MIPPMTERSDRARPGWLEEARAAVRRAARDDTRDGDAGRAAVRAHRPASRPRRARPRVLHEPRLPQGRRAAREPARRDRHPLVGARSTGARRGRRRGGLGGGVVGVLGDATAREQDRRLGLPPVAGCSTDRDELDRRVVEIDDTLRRRATSRSRPSGAATGSCPTPSSCGRIATTGSTIACGTCATARLARRAPGAVATKLRWNGATRPRSGRLRDLRERNSRSRFRAPTSASAPSVYRPWAFQSMYPFAPGDPRGVDLGAHLRRGRTRWRSSSPAPTARAARRARAA